MALARIVLKSQHTLQKLRGIGRDSSGNVLAMVAACAVPILAMIGGAVDMSRSYLAESRLQQACDAGVLAARKKLGGTIVTSGVVPANVVTRGNNFFNSNFRDGTYGTSGRTFAMTLEADYSISGVATVNVPTTIMKLFGNTDVPIRATCEARLNFKNTDVMMVLDTTQSMDTLAPDAPGPNRPRIEILKTTVRNFHNLMESTKGPGVSIRYGFVPYSTNVNVGALLQNNWVVNDWHYQGRETGPIVSENSTASRNDNYVETGTYSDTMQSSYPATFHPPTTENTSSWYSCDTPLPAAVPVYSYDPTYGTPVVTAYTGVPAGNQTTTHTVTVENGQIYRHYISGSTCQVWLQQFNNLRKEYDRVVYPITNMVQTYNYDSFPKNVANWRTTAPNTCIEERDTYIITDYNNVNFNLALDLNIDLVPNPANPATQWRPMYKNDIFEREIDYWGSGGTFNPSPVNSRWSYFSPTLIPNMVTCPSPAALLAEMPTLAALNAYLDTVVTGGTTYHDIGMIWGARLISKTGLFAAHNNPSGVQPANAHLIFLTDGQTEGYDIAYGAYGVEPLDRRRWVPPATTPGPGATDDLNEVIEARFGVACREAKKRNITVWIIGFGTTLNSTMTNCAGPGRFFVASDAAQLNAAFTRIATNVAELRVSK